MGEDARKGLEAAALALQGWDVDPGDSPPEARNRARWMADAVLAAVRAEMADARGGGDMHPVVAEALAAVRAPAAPPRSSEPEAEAGPSWLFCTEHERTIADGECPFCKGDRNLIVVVPAERLAALTAERERLYQQNAADLVKLGDERAARERAESALASEHEMHARSESNLRAALAALTAERDALEQERNAYMQHWSAERAAREKAERERDENIALHSLEVQANADLRAALAAREAECERMRKALTKIAALPVVDEDYCEDDDLDYLRRVAKYALTPPPSPPPSPQDAKCGTCGGKRVVMPDGACPTSAAWDWQPCPACASPAPPDCLACGRARVLVARDRAPGVMPCPCGYAPPEER